jgi:hypothetical protein
LNGLPPAWCACLTVSMKARADDDDDDDGVMGYPTSTLSSPLSAFAVT